MLRDVDMILYIIQENQFCSTFLVVDINFKLDVRDNKVC